jgi:hypothetical protein
MVFADLLRDPLTRLLMRSDGVTKQDMIVLSRRVRGALAAHDNAERDRGNNRASRPERARSTTICHS